MWSLPWLLISCSPTDTGFGTAPGDSAVDSPTDSPVDTGPLPDLRGWAEPVGLPTLQGQPDVVWVTLDTLRADMLGSGHTPGLAALFASGLTLTRHQASSNWTSPTMTAILAGQDPLEVGYFPTRLSVVPDALRLVGQVLGEQGYETWACTTNGVLGDAQLTRDYDHLGGWSEDARADEHVSWCLENTYADLAQRTAPALIHTHFLDPHDAYRAPQELVEEVMLDLYGEVLEPLTLWGKTYELDTDRGAYAELELRWPEYDDDERTLLVRYLAAIYAAEVRFLDRELPALFDGLQALGVDLDQAVVMVATDHGEQLFERGHLTHARSAFAEETAALAWLRAPGGPVGVYEGQTTHRDLASLLYGMLGVTEDRASGLAALDGAPRITTGFQCAQGEHISPLHAGQQAWALHSGGVRLVGDVDGTRRLYDARSDPGEAVDVYGTWDADPALLAELEAAVDGVEAQALAGAQVCLE